MQKTTYGVTFILLVLVIFTYRTAAPYIRTVIELTDDATRVAPEMNENGARTGMKLNASGTPAIKGLKGHFQLSPINPRDVFLFYTKTPKTSSTVAASLIMEAYTRYGIPISSNAAVTDAAADEAHFPGTFASISHITFTQDRLDNIARITGKPVILVVSIREGRDWLESWVAEANLETAQVGAGTFVEDQDICKRFSPENSANKVKGALNTYSSFLPIKLSSYAYHYKLTYKPWFVIRHEHVVDDTCDLLKRLGMDCNRAAAFGQASRKQVGLDNCTFTPDDTVIQGVNKMNKMLWESRAEHEGIKRE